MSRKNWFFLVLIAIAVGTLEATFLTLLPSPWREFRPVIDIAVLLIAINRSRAALVYAAICGFILDAFSVGGGSFAFARLILVMMMMIFLSETVITNRSVYATAALVVGARLLDRIWRMAAHVVGTALFRWDIRIEPLSSFSITLLWDIGSVSVAFVLLAVFTRRFLMTVARPNRFYDDV